MPGKRFVSGFLKLIFSTLILLFLSGSAFATTYSWTGGASDGGKWTTPANWGVGSGYPGSSGTSDIAQFTNGGTFTVKLTSAITIASLNETSGTTLLTVNTAGFALTINTAVALGTNSSTLTFLGSGAVSVKSMTFQNGDFLTCGSGSDATTKVSFTGAIITLAANSGNGIFNYGTFNLTTSQLYTGSTSQINNESGGTFNSTSSLIYLQGTSSSLVNSGNFNLTTSSLYLDVNPCSITNNPTGVLNMNASLISWTAANNEEFYNYGTVNATTGANSITMISGASDNNLYNYGTFNAGSGTTSVCTITVAATRGDIQNTSAVLSGTTYNGRFNLASGSIIKFDASCSNCQVNNDASCASCTFTLASDANSSATIYQIPSGSSCNGTFSVQRYFQGSNTYDNVNKRWLERNYRIISSPVHNTTQVNSNNVFGLNYIVGATAGQTTLASSSTNAFITGCTGGSTSSGNPSIYLYRESYTPSNSTFTSGNFVGITNITNSSTTGTITCSDGGTYSMPIGSGVFFFFRGAATNWSTRTASPYIAPDNVTLTSTGNINQQSVTVKDWYTPTLATLGYTGSGTGTNHAVRGFNMVGNPYPSTIDWCTAYASTGITRTSTVSPTIWVLNPQTNQYDTFIATSSAGGTATGNASRYIMSGQGFFVQATGTSPVSPALTFTESAKATNQLTGTSLLMGTPAPQLAGNRLLRLKVMIDSLNYDDIALVFNSSASTRYSDSEDALYIRSKSAPEGLSSFSDDSVKLAINSLPLPGITQRVIRLSVDATYTGTYTLQKTQLDDIPKLYAIWLRDNLKKDSLDIRNNSTYIFDVNTNDTTTYGDNRFQLVIRQNPALMVHLLSFGATKATNGSQVVWTTENEENYTDFTLERSTDGGATYAVLDGVAANARGTYSFLDKNPVLGTNSYRLKITDLNGAVTYSNVVTLMYANTTGIVASNIRIYPNPASSVVNLAIDQNNNSNAISGVSGLQSNSLNPGLGLTTGTNAAYDVRIINMKGAIVKTASTTQPSWQQSVSDLLPGTYVISVVSKADSKVVGSGTFIKL